MDMSVFTDGPAAMSDHNEEEVEVEEAEAGSPTWWGMGNGDELLLSGDGDVNDAGESKDGGRPDDYQGKIKEVAPNLAK